MHLQRYLIVVVVFDLSAGLNFVHSPIAARQTLKDIDTNPNAGMFKGGFEDGWDSAIGAAAPFASAAARPDLCWGASKPQKAAKPRPKLLRVKRLDIRGPRSNRSSSSPVN